MRKYRAEYSMTGADSGGNGSLTFEIDEHANELDAATKAQELIAEAEHERNKDIGNRFYHFDFKLTKLLRIIQEEIAEPVPKTILAMTKPVPRRPVVCQPVHDPYDTEI